MTITLRLALPAAAITLLAACATPTPPAVVTAPPAVKAAPAPAVAPAAPIAPPAPAAAAAPAVALAEAKEFYVVLPADGRIYAFGDAKNYQDYLAHGEVTLTRTKIGDGPGGKTLVFGITSEDVKANKPSLGELVMNGTLKPGSSFYGEVLRDRRYFMFGELKDMMDFVKFGEVPYSYTDIGTGPKGETMVYVMNKESYAKGKPADRLERFKSLRTAAK